jgi:hypothetical protein
MKKRLWLIAALIAAFALAFTACPHGPDDPEEVPVNWDEGVIVREIARPSDSQGNYLFIGGDNGMPSLASVVGENKTITFFILELEHSFISKAHGGGISIMLGNRDTMNWNQNFRDGYDLTAGWNAGDKAYYVFDIEKLPNFDLIENGFYATNPIDYQGRVIINGYYYATNDESSRDESKDETILENHKLYSTTQDIAGGPPGAIATKGTCGAGGLGTEWNNVVGYYVKNLKLNIEQ